MIKNSLLRLEKVRYDVYDKWIENREFFETSTTKESETIEAGDEDYKKGKKYKKCFLIKESVKNIILKLYITTPVPQYKTG
jgi:hypothetical protein